MLLDHFHCDVCIKMSFCLLLDYIKLKKKLNNSFSFNIRMSSLCFTSPLNTPILFYITFFVEIERNIAKVTSVI